MRGYTQFLVLCTVLFTVISALVGTVTPTQAAPLPQSELCGNGSAPDYGFSYRLDQPHWTVADNQLVSEQAMAQVDVILDKLNADNIAQTMILVKSADQVGIQTNCAVHFLRYMQLGQPDGPHKDNGFAFVIVVGTNKIDVHYAVGLGLPALVASKLTPINRLGEATFAETKSVDQALISVIAEFDAYTRTVYQPDPGTQTSPESIPQPINSGGAEFLTCLCALALFLLFLFVIQLLGGGGGSSGTFRSSGSRPSSGGFSNNSRSSTRSSTPSRGGSGSGRSGRTN